MDDAIMVQIAPGRFALGLSCGSGGRLAGDAVILTVGGPQPFHRMFSLPGFSDEGNTDSTAYFVKVQANEPLALAVRQKMIPRSEGDSRLVRNEFFYRLNARHDRYERASFPPAKLTHLIDAAERNGDSLQISQTGGMVFVGAEQEDEEAAAADRALNSVYQRLRQKLPPMERERLRQEEIDWLTCRDTVNSGRTDVVKQRVKELQERLEGKPPAKDPPGH